MKILEEAEAKRELLWKKNALSLEGAEQRGERMGMI